MASSSNQEIFVIEVSSEEDTTGAGVEVSGNLISTPTQRSNGGEEGLDAHRESLEAILMNNRKENADLDLMNETMKSIIKENDEFEEKLVNLEEQALLLDSKSIAISKLAKELKDQSTRLEKQIKVAIVGVIIVIIVFILDNILR